MYIFNFEANSFHSNIEVTKELDFYSLGVYQFLKYNVKVGEKFDAKTINHIKRDAKLNSIKTSLQILHQYGYIRKEEEI